MRHKFAQHLKENITLLGFCVQKELDQVFLFRILSLFSRLISKINLERE